MKLCENYQAQYIEFYNDGDQLPLSSNTLEFRGFMNSSAFGQNGGGGACNYDIPPDSYVVIYNPDVSFDDLACTDCNCTTPDGLTGNLDGGTLRCDNAIYIPCDTTATTSTCGACTWSTTMVCNI